MDDKKLLAEAKGARENAYAPYSGFTVGAALLTKSGRVYRGCNIENAGYSATNCAERTAFFKAVSEGETAFEKIAIVGGKKGESADELCAPCGVCRQVMLEFCRPEEFQIVLSKGKNQVLTLSLKELLPYGFGPDNLKY